MKSEEKIIIEETRSEWWMVAQVAILFVGISLAIWIAFLAPCSSLGWVPLKDLPARCLQ